MAVVIITNEYLLSEQEGHKAAEVRTSARTVPAIFGELATRFPRSRHVFFRDDGELRWTFTLIRGCDDTDVRYMPDGTEYGDEDRLYLISNVGD